LKAEIFAMLAASQEGVNIMTGAESKKLSLTTEDDLKIVAGSLESLAEHRAGKGKNFDSVDDLKAYLEKL
jgi:hypothetical protein